MTTITITVNDRPTEVPADHSVAALLAGLKLADSPCAVEVNRTLVPRHQHAGQILRGGDTVEIVTLVGGG